MKNFVDSTRDFITEWALNILILLFGTTTLVQAFIVPTPSMDKTVMVGDHLLVDKLSYAPSDSFSSHLLPYTEPKRGDIIVFRYPMDISQNYVKRCMGLPGDRIKVVDKDVYLNGHKLVEPYIQHIFPPIEPYRDNFPASPTARCTTARARCWRTTWSTARLWCPKGIISRWATIATIRSTAATGVSFRARTSSASRW